MEKMSESLIEWQTRASAKTLDDLCEACQTFCGEAVGWSNLRRWLLSEEPLPVDGIRVIFHFRGFEWHGKMGHLQEGTTPSSSVLLLQIPCGQKCVMPHPLKETDLTPILTVFNEQLSQGENSEFRMTLDKSESIALRLEPREDNNTGPRFMPIKIEFLAKGPWGDDTRWATRPIPPELMERLISLKKLDIH